MTVNHEDPVLPKQFFGSFHFLDGDRFVFMNSRPKVEPFNNFLVAGLSPKKILKEFAHTGASHLLNHKQRFAFQGDTRLWTCMGNEMKLKANDLKTGKKLEEIQIPGKYRESTVLESGGSGGSKMVVPIIYNTAQPFVIDDQLFS